MSEIRKTYYIKSLPASFEGIYHGTDAATGQPIIGQTTENIFQTLSLQPNVESFGLEKRICCSVLSTLYPNAFRPQGIIFTLTEQNSDMHYFSHDLLGLARMHDAFDPNTPVDIATLHHLYDKEILNKKIVERDHHSSMAAMLLAMHDYKHRLNYNATTPYSLQDAAFDWLNQMRAYYKQSPLSPSLRHITNYNEVYSHKPLHIKPVAIYADTHSPALVAATTQAQQQNLPLVTSLDDFLDTHPHNYRHDDSPWERKRIMELQQARTLLNKQHKKNISDPEETISTFIELLHYYEKEIAKKLRRVNAKNRA